MHLVHFSKPHLQRHVIRVLWMVPIYGINAWLVRPALPHRHPSPFCSPTDAEPSCPLALKQALLLGLICADEKWILMPDTFRQCYEAYTIYSFYRFVFGAQKNSPSPLSAGLSRHLPCPNSTTRLRFSLCTF